MRSWSRRFVSEESCLDIALRVKNVNIQNGFVRASGEVTHASPRVQGKERAPSEVDHEIVKAPVRAHDRLKLFDHGDR